MANRTIVTSHINPPIPVRQFDWCAFYDGEEEAGNYGYGATEQDAIDDFKDNFQADHDDRLSLKSQNPFLQGEWKANQGWSDPMMGGAACQYPDWCEVTGPAYLSINGHFGIEVAHIIAAAPNMLTALKALMPEGWGHDDTMDHMPGVKLARLAIAKAEGK